jgi:uncharacterized protein
VKFWDTSAVVPLLLDQPHTAYVEELLESDQDITVWWGTLVECSLAFARLRREGVISIADETDLTHSLEQLRAHWVEMAPSEEIRSTARRLVRAYRLRAADSLQLAAAVVWSGQFDAVEFVSFDTLLRETAQLEGLVAV